MNSPPNHFSAASPFLISQGARAERHRRRAILAAHPEIHALIGPNHWSAALVLVLLAVQIGLAIWLAGQPAWLMILVAYGCGALMAANLTAMIHEAAHGLIFARPWADRAIAVIANFGLGLPSAIGFFHYHRWHHIAIGDYRMDVGIPTVQEALWVRGHAWRKALWLAGFPLVQALRVAKFIDREPYWTIWMTANLVIQILIGITIIANWGFISFCYLLLSFYFALGFHPIGTRVVQEHFVIAPGHETNNYVSWFSPFECNFGYHAEHHDFPSIAWNRLPKVSKLAAEFYADIPVLRSRIGLMVSFIRDRQWDVRRHAVRAANQ